MTGHGAGLEAGRGSGQEPSAGLGKFPVRCHALPPQTHHDLSSVAPTPGIRGHKTVMTFMFHLLSKAAKKKKLPLAIISMARGPAKTPPDSHREGFVLS